MFRILTALIIVPMLISPVLSKECVDVSLFINDVESTAALSGTNIDVLLQSEERFLLVGYTKNQENIYVDVKFDTFSRCLTGAEFLTETDFKAKGRK